MTSHKIGHGRSGSRPRARCCKREKEHTRLGDELARQRRELPWVAVEKEYRFDTDDGTRTLAELFDGRSQLHDLPLHVRAELPGGVPGQLVDGRWPGRPAAAPACPRRDPAAGLAGSAGEAAGVQAADGLEHSLGLGGEHRLQLRLRRLLHPRSRCAAWGLDEGSLPPIVAQNAAATGTDIPGYLSESPAVSVFTLQDGAVYQTYATAARGVEFLMGYYPILDRAPKGRDEGDAFQTWIRRHDEYA